MDTLHYAPLLDCTIQTSHHENYKGWKILVEISGRSCMEEGDPLRCRYLPRIVATEQLSIGFREVEVPSEQDYPTPEGCIRGGILAARRFVDGR